MFDQKKILLTGGKGLLGSEIRKNLPEISVTDSESFDITNYSQMDDFVKKGDYQAILHAAAFISPPLIEKDPLKAIAVNIVGTSNVVKLCWHYKLKLVYISTDYVFKGDKGNYSEDDPVFPTNKYAWSKLGGECAVRMYDNSLIIRTTFGPNIFPYEKAFVDQWTSRECVREIAKKICFVLSQDIIGTIHVGGSRKTVFEYAMSLDPEKVIKELSINDVNFKVPVDTSMNCSKLNMLYNHAWKGVNS